jgi:hypothetical protein
VHHRITALAVGVAAAVTIIAPMTAAAAQPATAHPLFTCTSKVTSPEANVSPSVDWLKVHSTYGTSAPTVGQLKSGTQFCITSNSHPVKNGYSWTYGYGYNGSTKLTGWVAAEDLIYP